MASQYPLQPSQQTSATPMEAWRHKRKSAWPAQQWPINEILLESFVRSGMTDGEIAEKYGVAEDQVIGLRRTYGL